MEQFKFILEEGKRIIFKYDDAANLIFMYAIPKHEVELDIHYINGIYNCYVSVDGYYFTSINCFNSFEIKEV